MCYCCCCYHVVEVWQHSETQCQTQGVGGEQGTSSRRQRRRRLLCSASASAAPAACWPRSAAGPRGSAACRSAAKAGASSRDTVILFAPLATIPPARDRCHTCWAIGESTNGPPCSQHNFQCQVRISSGPATHGDRTPDHPVGSRHRCKSHEPRRLAGQCCRRLVGLPASLAACPGTLRHRWSAWMEAKRAAARPHVPLLPAGPAAAGPVPARARHPATARGRQRR